MLQMIRNFEVKEGIVNVDARVLDIIQLFLGCWLLINLLLLEKWL